MTPFDLQGAVRGLGELEAVIDGQLWALGRTACAIAALQFIASLCRIPPGHWRCPELRRLLVSELTFGVGAMAAFAGAPAILRPTPVSWLLLTVAALAALIHYDVVEQRISGTIADHDELTSCTQYWSERRPFQWIGSEQTIGEWSRKGELPLHRIAARYLELPRPNRYSRLRRIVVGLMTWLVVESLICTMTLAAQQRLERDGPMAPKAATSEDKGSASAPARVERRPAKQATNGLPAARARDEDRSSSSWSAECGPRPGARPEDRGRVTEQERTMLDALYLKGIDLNADGRLDADDPPGAAGGCTGAVQVSARKGTRLAYVIGTDPRTGRRLSVAVVSGQFDPAIFIHPAVTPVLALIELYGDIGGMRHVDVGGGQVYGVQTPYGTAVLARATTERRDAPGQAQPYVLLLPAAAAAWAKAIEDHGSWLWPLDGGTVNGVQRVRLVSDLASDDTIATIFVDHATRRARYDGQSSWGGPFGYEISRSELESYGR